MNITAGGKLSSIDVAISLVIYWSVRLSNRRNGTGKMGVGGIVILDRFKFHFIKEHDNLV